MANGPERTPTREKAKWIGLGTGATGLLAGLPIAVVIGVALFGGSIMYGRFRKWRDKK